MKAAETWSYENSVSVKCIVCDWVCCVFLCYTMPYGSYLHLSPKDTIQDQKGGNPGGFFQGDGKCLLRNVLHTKCCIFSVFLRLYEDHFFPRDNVLYKWIRHLDQQSNECWYLIRSLIWLTLQILGAIKLMVEKHFYTNSVIVSWKHTSAKYLDAAAAWTWSLHKSLLCFPAYFGNIKLSIIGMDWQY